MKVDQQINEWKVKCDEIQVELENAQKDSRAHFTEVGAPFAGKKSRPKNNRPN